MKKFVNKLINPFMPAYEVVCTNYHIIPGLPVSKNQSVQYFDRGAGKEAKAFYNKVINSQFTRNLAPVEVHLRMAGITIKKAQIGPVNDLKQFKMAS